MLSNLQAGLTYVLTLLHKELFGLRENKEFPCVRTEGQGLQLNRPRVPYTKITSVVVPPSTRTAELEGTKYRKYR